MTSLQQFLDLMVTTNYCQLYVPSRSIRRGATLSSFRRGLCATVQERLRPSRHSGFSFDVKELPYHIINANARAVAVPDLVRGSFQGHWKG
jgi:hypothetical protein